MKTCPYCGEKIQDTAKKCRYCGEWLNDKGNETNDIKGKGELTHKKTSSKGPIITIILIFVGIVAYYFLMNVLNKKESRQGFYYPVELSEGTEISGPIFDNFQACQDWALSKFSDGKEAYCSKNCHDSVDGTPICEDVVRTWHPLPGFGTVFSGADGIREILEQKAYEEQLKQEEEERARYQERYDAYWKCRDRASREFNQYMHLNYGCPLDTNNCTFTPRQEDVQYILSLTEKTSKAVDKCNDEYPDIPRQK